MRLGDSVALTQCTSGEVGGWGRAAAGHGAAQALITPGRREALAPDVTHVPPSARHLRQLLARLRLCGRPVGRLIDQLEAGARWVAEAQRHGGHVAAVAGRGGGQAAGQAGGQPASWTRAAGGRAGGGRPHPTGRRAPTGRGPGRRARPWPWRRRRRTRTRARRACKPTRPGQDQGSQSAPRARGGSRGRSAGRRLGCRRRGSAASAARAEPRPAATRAFYTLHALLTWRSGRTARRRAGP